MKHLLHEHSAFRIFGFSVFATVATLIGITWGLGWGALFVTIILMVVELTFSFDNAIINAKILERMSPFWQMLFLTVGIFIAIFGMRVVFPILIVSITADLGWKTVLDLALNNPKEYAQHLDEAHPTISAFGGAFLLMLAFHFFFSDERNTMWIKHIEGHLKRLSHWAWPSVVTTILLFGVAMLPINSHARTTFLAGGFGTLTYLLIHGAIKIIEKYQGVDAKKSAVKQVGLAAFMSFVYLEILDASFSFDGVIGAFAITSNVVLIAAGLGIGAIWVRSMTVFMVRRGTLKNFIYLEHGAHYTVLVLAIIMLFSALYHIPELIPGLAGIGIIGASIAASVRVRKKLETGEVKQ
ncbi:DUF475 domain-containing protein [Candidatus Saccharibacteria bacterium]|nr:MAG: DUF475 domain-containing protein [Candidatus Saccharibacteria bacterium]